jgi:hypothetical protein
MDFVVEEKAMRNRVVKVCVMFAAISLLAGSIGCYETLFRLSPLAEAKVDRELCGDWKLKSTGGADIILGVRNIDDHVYSVSWRGTDSEKALQMIADSTLVQGVRFVHARALPEDGSVADTHLIIRVDLEGDRITVRNLNEAYLETKKIESDDALRAEIEANLENNDLYDDASYSGERMKDE